MARIITINCLKRNVKYYEEVGRPEWISGYCTHSINLETVFSLTCHLHPYPNRVRVKNEPRGFWERIFGDEYKIVECGTFFDLVFGYKNYRHSSDLVHISQEEYERLKPELAKYGWHI